MSHKVTVIPGDGIGPEVVDAAKRCVEATGVKIDWEEVHAGENVMEKEGTPLPESVLQSIRKNKVALKGPITTPLGSGFRSVNVAIRKELGLFANLRPAKYYKGIRSRVEGAENIDLVIVRENTEDLYAGIEFEKGTEDGAALVKTIKEFRPDAKIGDDASISIKPISVSASRRIAKFAFNHAKQHGRKKVTAVTKSNIMKFSDGLFQKIAEETAVDYPEIKYEHKIIDNMCMQLVQNPEEYDLLVLPNLYGDIVSDLAAGLVGGLGVAPGANYGDGIAVFEAVHGSAPSYAGQNLANPTALILTSVLMLRHLGETKAADRLEQAVAAVIAEGKDVTYDLREDRDKSKASGTREMADAIIAKLGVV